ncbi:MAG: hypothetical protein KKF67_02205, partial [Nanoarchaeota archaeon]|nr:hypothetical protein [Nanoarchaeota archaeon]
MGWFNKKEQGEERIPQLPELPKLPEFPRTKEEYDDSQTIHRLPSFPNSQLGQKFSQNTIKEAVTGRKEVEDAYDADDSEDDETQTTPGHPEMNYSHEITFPFKEDVERKIIETPREFKGISNRNEKKEPIFIRLDKFEESVDKFEEMKKSITEIEKMLGDVRIIKEKEGRELEEWEKELKIIKGQIDSIERDVFSKVE